MSTIVKFNGHDSMPELMAVAAELKTPIRTRITNLMPRDVNFHQANFFLRFVGSEGSVNDFVFVDKEALGKLVDHFAQIGQLNHYKEIFNIEFLDDSTNAVDSSVTTGGGAPTGADVIQTDNESASGTGEAKNEPLVKPIAQGKSSSTKGG